MFKKKTQKEAIQPIWSKSVLYKAEQSVSVCPSDPDVYFPQMSKRVLLNRVREIGVHSVVPESSDTSGQGGEEYIWCTCLYRMGQCTQELQCYVTTVPVVGESTLEVLCEILFAIQ